MLDFEKKITYRCICVCVLGYLNRCWYCTNPVSVIQIN